MLLTGIGNHQQMKEKHGKATGTFITQERAAENNYYLLSPLGNITLSGSCNKAASTFFIRFVRTADDFFGSTKYTSKASTHVFALMRKFTKGYSFISISSTGVSFIRSRNSCTCSSIPGSSSCFAILRMVVSTHFKLL